MSNIKSTTDAQLPDRLYGEHYPDSFLDVSKSIRKPSVATLGDYIQQLQEINSQPDQPCIACEPSRPDESKFDHICPNNPILTCNCTDPKFCAELGSDPDGTSAEGTTTEKGRARSEDGSQDGFADNIDYTGIPTPSPQRKDAVSGWPCVVVGAVCETGTSAAEHILRTTASEWNTEQRIDARRDYDGFIKANGF
jgi:hypothetical protein